MRISQINIKLNDACVAMAEYVSGSVEIFVDKMNERAKELGMKDTNFVNTNGLPVANHYTSAYDIALMSKMLLKYSIPAEWFTAWQDSITVGLPGKEKEIGLTNTNRLIKIYTGANGIKTGFTQEAGYCLSGSATKEDMTLIAVILGSSSSKIRFAEAGKLLDYGFAHYDTVKIAQKGEPAGGITIEKGNPLQIETISGEDIYILVEKGKKDGVTSKAIFDKELVAPIKAGDQVGEAIVYKDKKEVGRYPLLAQEDVEKATIKDLYIRMMKNLI